MKGFTDRILIIYHAPINARGSLYLLRCTIMYMYRRLCVCVHARAHMHMHMCKRGRVMRMSMTIDVFVRILQPIWGK